MGDGRGDDQQEPGRRGQGRGQAAGRHQGDDPVRELRDLGRGQDHDVVIDVEFVGVVRGLVLEHALAGRPGFAAENRFALEGRAGAVGDDAVVVLVHPGQEARLFPVLEPGRGRGVGGVAQHVGQGVAREGAQGRGRGVEDGDEKQGIEGRDARGPHRGYGVEADDDVGQSGRADHEAHGDGEDVDHGLGSCPEGRGVFGEAQVRSDLVQGVEQVFSGVRAVDEGAAEADLGQVMSRQLGGNGDGRDQEGRDEHAVLGDLGPGDALHAADAGVEEDQDHADDHARVDVHFKEAAEDDAHAAHLPGHVGQGDEDGADQGHNARGRGVIAVADEVRHRELAELAQVGGQEQGQEHVSAGPAHEVHAAGVAHEGDHAGHGDEGRRTHPVRGRGHAVGQGRHAAAGHVEALGVFHPRAPGDADVEREGRPDDEIGPDLQ
ncbi:hypothetical protein DSECCO2_503360 [anaerobic digester metagenome]